MDKTREEENGEQRTSRDDAHGRHDEQVVGGRAHNGARAELAGLEVVADHFDHRQEDLRRARPERHERQVRDRRVPHAHPPLHHCSVALPPAHFDRCS